MIKQRVKKPSNAVKKSVTLGSTLALLGGTALAWAQGKYQIDPLTMQLIGGVLSSLTASAVAYKSRGGRVGESD